MFPLCGFILPNVCTLVMDATEKVGGDWRQIRGDDLHMKRGIQRGDDGVGEGGTLDDGDSMALSGIESFAIINKARERGKRRSDSKKWKEKRADKVKPKQNHLTERSFQSLTSRPIRCICRFLA